MNEETLHPNYSLTKSKEESTADDEGYINTLPRAVIRPNSFVLLDGDWSFDVDPENKGLTEGWYIAHQYKDTAHWPGSVEVHMAKAHPEATQTWRENIVVWYEREFPKPELMVDQHSPQSLLQLTFGSF